MKISFVSNFPSVNLAQHNICILPFTDTRTRSRSVGRLLIRSTDLVITTEAARPARYAAEELQEWRVPNAMN